ncbi:MAG: hypothetical protein ABIL06_12950 [Pseudomonadota bacterium]|uniref:Uncharacterized protein n=1 Tax=viral metagenome TaxID=1070528 RepID=A0A6M3JK05_9ZZZZ
MDLARTNELFDRVRKLEKQIGFLIDRFNIIENKIQQYGWQITALQPKEADQIEKLLKTS